MISEKTVELNLTLELINHYSALLGRPLIALAPSSRAEGKCGFDTSIIFPRLGGFVVQYKTLTRKNGCHVWRLNETRAMNQHAKLLNLETRGVCVCYGLPMFNLPMEVITHRRGLLARTWWPRPSDLCVPPPLIGRHRVIHDLVSNIFTVQSEPLRIPPLPNFDTASGRILNALNVCDLNDVLRLCNECIFADTQETADETPSQSNNTNGDDQNEEHNLADGLVVLAISP